jgi:phytoene dehydrogenase-like protein
VNRPDVAVVGTGFGGLGAALTLAEAGANVVIFEALKYPGGCASTFSRGPYRFEAGATLSAGLGPGQLLRTWRDRYAPELGLVPLDPALELRTPDGSWSAGPDRNAFVEALVAADGPQVREAFRHQRAAAEILWSILDDPELLPPLDLSALWRHMTAAVRTVPLARWGLRSLGSLLDAWKVPRGGPTRTWFDVVSQITVQCPSDEAEALFALGAVDYPWRGVAHVQGGIGALAWALLRASEQRGAQVRLANRVTGLERSGRRWRVTARGQVYEVDDVVVNTLPGDLATLLGAQRPGLSRRQMRVESGWGACTWYLGLDAGGLPSGPRHAELVYDPRAPLAGGNHVLLSLADDADARAPTGQRVATLSTHVEIKAYTADPAGTAKQVQDRMRTTLRSLAPEVEARIRFAESGSPRTFARFTRRSAGFVGGIPRRVGWKTWADMLPLQLDQGLHLVGDSVLLGQSALAAATSGQRTATRILRHRQSRRA